MGGCVSCLGKWEGGGPGQFGGELNVANRERTGICGRGSLGRRLDGNVGCSSHTAFRHAALFEDILSLAACFHLLATLLSTIETSAALAAEASRSARKGACPHH